MTNHTNETEKADATCVQDELHDNDDERVNNAREEAEKLRDGASFTNFNGGKIDELEKQLSTAKDALAEEQEKVLRLHADMQNLEQRSQKAIQQARLYGFENIAKALLGVFDSLDSGIAAMNEATDVEKQVESLKEGMNLTYKQLIDTFSEFGIKLINPEGENFDPQKHEALSLLESKDVKPNTVMHVVQKGFSIHDRVLRSARVIVAKEPA